MATLSDRPRGKSKPPPEPASQPSGGPQAPPPEQRRRGSRLVTGAYLLAPISAVLAGLLAVAAVALAIVLNLGSGAVPPATGAANLVPANTLLYLHFSTDPSRPAVRQVLTKARRLPDASLLGAAITGRLDAMLAGSRGASVDFSAQVRPWLGREAAFAALDTPGSTAGTLIVLDVRHRARASAFLTGTGALPDGSYRRVRLLRAPSGTVLAFLRHYLVLGQRASVTAAIDVAAAGNRSLAASAAYQHAAAGEPADRVIDFYAPVAGVRRALVPRQGLLGALGVLLDQPALSAVTVSISPTTSGLGVYVHSALDPQLAAALGSQPAPFVPALPSALPAGSTILLDVANLRSGAPKLFAAAARAGVAGRFVTVLGEFGSALRAQGVNVGSLFSIFDGESALAVVPGRDGAGPAPMLVGRTAHPAAARRVLGNLEGPLTEAFAPPTSGAGVAPEVNDITVDGVTVSQLALAPGFQLDWAVAHGLALLSTRLGAIAAVLRHSHALSDERAYRATMGAVPGQVTSLVFLEAGSLLRLGSRLGLIGNSALTTLGSDLEQVRAIGLASVSGQSDTTSQLQLQIR